GDRRLFENGESGDSPFSQQEFLPLEIRLSGAMAPGYRNLSRCGGKTGDHGSAPRSPDQDLSDDDDFDLVVPRGGPCVLPNPFDARGEGSGSAELVASGDRRTVGTGRGRLPRSPPFAGRGGARS